MQVKQPLSAIAFVLCAQFAHADILSEAEIGVKIPLVKMPTTRPMTVAYEPNFNNYYIADGGLAPMGSEFEMPVSKSEIHAYAASGKYINSAKPGYDNRSIYFNPNTKQLETITYNISSDAGFFPNTGIFSLELSETGEIKDTSGEISQIIRAFGDAATMPSYNPETNQYYAKQEHSNKVFVVDIKTRKKVKELALDLQKAGAQHHDISDHYVAYTGIKDQELCVLDVDHKAVLFFNLDGDYVGKSKLPKDKKLRSKNHFNGLGYTNNMMFVYYETEGEFGTYYGFKVTK